MFSLLHTSGFRKQGAEMEKGMTMQPMVVYKFSGLGKIYAKLHPV